MAVFISFVGYFSLSVLERVILYSRYSIRTSSNANAVYSNPSWLQLGMVVLATEGTIKSTYLYQGEVMVLVGEVKMEYVSDCDGITSTRDGSLKESVSRAEQSGTAGPVSAVALPVPVGVGVSGDRDDRDDGDLGDISTAGGRAVRGVDRAVS